MRLTGNVVALTGTLAFNSLVTHTTTSTGVYSERIVEEGGDLQLFKRSSGVVTATLDKPSIKQIIEVT